MTTVADARGLRLELGGRVVLDGVSLAVAAGERVAVLGPSGAGKTSLLRVVAGLERPAAGTVALGGVAATDGPRLLVPPEARGVGLVFQELALWSQLTVEETIAVAARGGRAERRARAARLAERLGLGGRLGARPGELSGGEAQRLALARALAPDPRLLLLDEPFAHLDATLRRSLGEDLLALAAEQGRALVVVTHDRRDVLDLAERVVVLDRGRVVEEGAVADVCAAPRTRVAAALLELGALVDGARAADGLETPLGRLALRPGVDAQARTALLRPDDLLVAPQGPEGAGAPASEGGAGAAGVVRRRVVLRPDASPPVVGLEVALDAGPVLRAAGPALAAGSRVRVRAAGPVHLVV